MVSGPAHRVEGRPPSRARDATTEFCAASPSRRNARYRLDFPLPLAPVTRLSRPSGRTRSRRERYPEIANVSIMREGYGVTQTGRELILLKWSSVEISGRCGDADCEL